jgi:glycosyltransferase involved in cell wall biosynthesis
MTADAVGGVWTYALDLTRGLAAYDVDVVLAVMGPAPDAAQREHARSIANLELVWKSYPLEWFHNFSETDLTRSGAWLRDQAADFKADLVHINGYAHAAGNWEIPAIVVAHSCVCSWWMAVHGTNPPEEYSPYRERVLAGLMSASAVVAPSQWMLDGIRTTYRVRLKRSEVIHNFSSASPCFAEKKPVIFACGRFWDPAKNLELLDRVGARTLWPIQVAGSRWSPEGIEQNCSHLELLGQLPRAEVLRQLSRAAIFAHPARYEPFGLAVLEAASSGCALVLADIPPLRELWRGGAIFVAPDDAKEWTACLNHLARNERDRSMLARGALERSRDFRSDSAVKQYVRLYERLCCTPIAAANPKTDLHELEYQTLLPLHRF